MKTKFKKPLKIFLWILVPVLLATVFVSTYQFLSRPEKIDTGIAKFSKKFTGHTAGVWAAKFSPDGMLIASGSIDSTVIIRDRATGKILSILKHPDGVTNLAFSNDGKFIVTSSYDAIVRSWNVDDGSLVKTFGGSQHTVWTVAFSPDGRTIAGGGEENDIIVWDVNSGVIMHTLKGHKLNVWSIKFSPDGTKIASGSFDNTIHIWDASSGKLIRIISGHSQAVVDLAFSHDGKILASTSDDKTIRFWDTNSGAFIKALEVEEHVQAVAFSPDDKRLMTGGRDKTMLGELIQNFTGDSEKNKGVSARLWDIASGKIIQTFTSHSNDVNDVDYSNDGKWIATASADKTVELWELVK